VGVAWVLGRDGVISAGTGAGVRRRLLRVRADAAGAPGRRRSASIGPLLDGVEAGRGGRAIKDDLDTRWRPGSPPPAWTTRSCWCARCGVQGAGPEVNALTEHPELARCVWPPPTSRRARCTPGCSAPASVWRRTRPPARRRWPSRGSWWTGACCRPRRVDLHVAQGAEVGRPSRYGGGGGGARRQGGADLGRRPRRRGASGEILVPQPE